MTGLPRRPDHDPRAQAKKQARYPVPGRLLAPATCAAVWRSGGCAAWYPEFRPSIPGVPSSLISNRCQSVARFNPDHIAPNTGHPGGVGVETDFYL